MGKFLKTTLHVTGSPENCLVRKLTNSGRDPKKKKERNRKHDTKRMRTTNMIRTEANRLVVALRDQQTLRLSPQYLLDHQKSNWHASTNQKLAPSSTLPSSSAGFAKVEEKDGELRIDWDDQSSSVLPLAQLLRRTTTSSRYGLPEKRAWKSLEEIPQSTFEQKDQKKILEDLSVWGVHMITGMPQGMDETEAFVRSTVGIPRETFYGRMWDTAPRDGDINDTAYTFDALDTHTDTCYLEDSPGLQCFNCVAQACQGEGGETVLVDSERALGLLKERHPDTFRFFTEQPLVFHHIEEGLETRVVAPVIDLETTGEIKQFRYNEYDLAPLDYLDETTCDAFYKHNKVLRSVLDECLFLLKLRVGDLIIIDNHRVLHGRKGFTGYRNLVGCYVGKDEWVMRARALLKPE